MKSIVVALLLCGVSAIKLETQRYAKPTCEENIAQLSLPDRYGYGCDADNAASVLLDQGVIGSVHRADDGADTKYNV